MDTFRIFLMFMGGIFTVVLVIGIAVLVGVGLAKVVTKILDKVDKDNRR